MVQPKNHTQPTSLPPSQETDQQAQSELKGLRPPEVLRLLQAGSTAHSAPSLHNRARPVSTSELGFFGRVWASVSRLFCRLFGMQGPSSKTPAFDSLEPKNQLSLLQEEVKSAYFDENWQPTRKTTRGSSDLLERLAERWIEIHLPEAEETKKTEWKNYLMGSDMQTESRIKYKEILEKRYLAADQTIQNASPGQTPDIPKVDPNV